jgi:hypothetical protein
VTVFQKSLSTAAQFCQRRVLLAPEINVDNRIAGVIAASLELFQCIHASGDITPRTSSERRYSR